MRYVCPRCTTVLESPDRNAGSKVSCPTCGQRLQVPLPPVNKTVLAPLVPLAASPHPQAIPLQPPPMAAHPQGGPQQPVPVAAGPQPPPTSLPAPPLLISPSLPRPRVGTGWRPVFVLAGLCLAVVATMALATWLAGHSLLALVRPPGAVAEARSEPQTEAEELVKRWVVNNSLDRKAVTFTRWGPHMTGKEIAGLVTESGVGELAVDEAARRQLQGRLGELDRVTIVRVCYRAPGLAHPFFPVLQPPPAPNNHPDEHAFDQVFLVKGKLVYPFPFPNDAGDDWKRALRKQLAQFFPAIDTERP